MSVQPFRAIERLLHCLLVLVGATIFAANAASPLPVSTGANPYRSDIVPDTGNLAIYGYDPVAYFIEGRAVRGKAEFTHRFAEARWQFSSAENLKAFISNPIRYLPQYGGYCAVCMVEHEDLFDGNPKIWAIVNGKLYFNNNLRAREKFRRNTRLYVEWADEVWRKFVRPDGDADPTGYKIAFFPIALEGNSVSLSLDTESTVKETIRSALGENEFLWLAYDYESVTPGARVISSQAIWPRAFGIREPNLSSVVELSRQLEVDGVVTAWAQIPGSSTGVDRGVVEISVIDSVDGTVYRERGFVIDLKDMLKRAFSRFLENRKAVGATFRRAALFPLEFPTHVDGLTTCCSRHSPA